jgi:hypothetical protein
MPSISDAPATEILKATAAASNLFYDSDLVFLHAEFMQSLRISNGLC